MSERPSSTTVDRFWSLVRIGAPGTCWSWTGSRTIKGYGRVQWVEFNGFALAHRVAWELVNGPIPDGAMILHSCDNPPCCNPGHLRPGTAQDNVDDCWSRDRGVRLIGERNGKTKLSNEQVAAIRDDERKGTVIAVEYGVSQALVSMVRKGKSRQSSPGQLGGNNLKDTTRMKRINIFHILAVALLAFSAPAFATDPHPSRHTIGSTFAKSGSGAATSGSGYSGVVAHGGNYSWGTASVAPGTQRSATGSYSSGAGWSGGLGAFDTLGVGKSGAGTFGRF